MISQETRTKLAELISAIPEVEIAYLFGSQIEGGANTTSDLDIACVFSISSTCRPEAVQVALTRSGIDFHAPLDVRELNLKSDPIFTKRVIGRGDLLFSRDERRRIAFEVNCMRRVYDSEFIRRANVKGMKHALQDGRYGH